MPKDSIVLDRRVTLIQPTVSEVRDSLNNPKPADPIEHEVWANREDTGGKETVTTRLMVSQTNTVFTIRYRQDIDNTWSIVDRGVTFGIEFILEVGRRLYLEIHTKSNKN